MPLPVIENTFRVALNWAEGAGPVHSTNVMHVQNVGGDGDAVADAIIAHATANMWACVTTDLAVRMIVVTDLGLSFAATVERSISALTNLTGGSSGDQIPASAGIVKLATPQRGRSFRGRLFLGPIGESDNAAGLLGSTKQASMQTAWSTFLTDMATASFPVGVASYKLAQFTACSAAIVERGLGTQRRRQERARA